MDITYKHIRPSVKKKQVFSDKILISPYYGFFEKTYLTTISKKMNYTLWIIFSTI